MMLRGGTAYLCALFLALSMVRGLIYASIIPPWQAPDETAHFEYISLLYQERHLLQPQDASLPLQQEIISSMYEHRFWSYILHPAPEIIPLSLADIPFVGLSSVYVLGRFSLAYPLSALFFGPVFYQDIVTQLYGMRLVSVILSMLVVGMAFLTVRELFPDDKFLLVTVPAWIVFLPQHTHIASSVSDGNPAELLVSILIYVVVVSFKRGLSPWRAVLVALLLPLSLLTKASAVFVLPWLGLVIPIYVWAGDRSVPITKRAREAMVAVVVIVVGVTLGSAMTGRGLAYWRSWISILSEQAQLYMDMDFPTIRFYAILLFESFWAYFGWLAVPMDSSLYALLGTASVVATLGLVALLAYGRGGPRILEGWQRTVICILGLCALLSTTMGFVGARGGPQGRYLYPAIIAFSILFMLGIRRLVPSHYEKYLLPLSITSFFLFDALCLLGYILPFFYGSG